MYKDKAKQREAVKQATRRYRTKGITKVSHDKGITTEKAAKALGITVIPIEQLCITDDRQEAIDKQPEPQSYAGAVARQQVVKPQSHSPMMVGYVPPDRG